MNKVMFDNLFNCVVNEIKTSKSHQVYSVPLCDLLVKSKTAIYREYLDIKSLAAANFAAGKEGFMERHRCAASVMIAFLKKLNVGEKWAVITYAKEKVAIFVGLTTLRAFIEDDNSNHNNAGIIAFLNKNGEFRLPELAIKDDSYKKNWTLELYSALQKGHLFVPPLSNELFCIEAYNRRLSEI